jgi:gamma-glutamylputrescine oxidase
VTAPTWYHATAPALPAFPQLDGDLRVDVVVIGAGLTGLSAALTLAEQKHRVVVLEKARIGLGASGRNGGQVHSGQRREQDYLEKAVGRDDAMKLWRMAEDAKVHLRGLIARHGIDCDWRYGLIHADHKRRFVPHTHAYAEHLRDIYGYDRIDLLDRDALRAMVHSRDYHGGYLDRGAAQLHPLKLVQGLARAATEAGAEIYEMTEASGLTPGAEIAVETPLGTVRAARVIVAGDALMRGLDPVTDAHVMPIASTVAVTEPLGESLRAYLPTDAAVSDSRFVVNYFRPTHDGRLFFGGGESYSTTPVANPGRLVRRALAKVFPSLRDVRFDHAWSGIVGVTTTRLPLVRRAAPNVLVAAGYSGQGLALAPLFGHILAEAAMEPDARLDLLMRLPTSAFPGGAWLRHPLLVAAMSYFALRDRL